MNGILAPIEQQIKAERPVKSEYEIRRSEYEKALREAGVENTRFAHNPFWREKWLSIQNACDAHAGKGGSIVWTVVQVLMLIGGVSMPLYLVSTRHY